MANATLALVCMPWHLLEGPSIQLGTLAASLREVGVSCSSHSFFVELQSFALARAHTGHPALTVAEYGEVGTRWTNTGACEWVFAVPPHGCAPTVGESGFLEHLRRSGLPKKLATKLRHLRALVPAFLEHCADEVLSTEPAIVGFSTVYAQTMASVALAGAIKARRPSVQILFGGANCEGPMGPAMLRAFPVIDYVLRGEAEAGLPKLIEAVLGGDGAPHVPGVCYRSSGETSETGEPGGTCEIVEIAPATELRPPVDRLPVPHYDEYFRRLESSPLAGAFPPRIPFESARGCWWGQKAHCTFCGLNGTSMEFRSKPAERVLADLSELATRHSVLDFTAVDNIMELGFFRTLLPRLAEGPHDLSLFCETKANLTLEQVELLSVAGVRTIQPGIESLSTPVLAHMKKGVTALQNIRLLKWCAQHGLHVIWNLIYGFPGEAPEEYERMARVVPSLVHLSPPSMTPLMTVRFSPYHERPASYGLRLLGPLPYFGMLYDADDETLWNLSSVFEHEHADGRDPRSYASPLEREIERWRSEAPRNRHALTYRRGPGFLTITDTRSTSGAPARYSLGEAQARVYLALDAGATADTVSKALAAAPGPTLDDTSLRSFLDELLQAGLAYEERGRYLSLATPIATSWPGRRTDVPESARTDPTPGRARPTQRPRSRPDDRAPFMSSE